MAQRLSVPPQAIVWDEYLTGPFGLIAQYSLLKVSLLIMIGFQNGGSGCS